jgi:diacylglycerol kinase (ATP)
MKHLQPDGSGVAVIAHRGKLLGGGLMELRRVLADNGVNDPLWYEIDKSRTAPKRVREAIKQDAGLIIVWGGDGTVQRCIDVIAGTDVALAIIPAGTANLLATNLAISSDIAQAVRTALRGVRRRIDVGTINDECFAVMGGAGFDGVLMSSVSSAEKEQVGRIAYLRGSVQAMKAKRTKTKVRLNGHLWFDGPTSCVLVGNVGTITGGLHVFDNAKVDDGLLDVGVVSADGPLQWARVLGRVIVRSDVDRSPFVDSTQAAKIDVRFDKKVPYEIDGGPRGKSDHLKIRVRPQAVIVCVPEAVAPAGATTVFDEPAMAANA